MPITPPPFSASAISAPLIWRWPGSPRNWLASSASIESPVAPTGWPLDTRPPEVFTGQLAARSRGAGVDELAALAFGSEAQHLALVDLAEAGGIVQLGDA